MRLPIGAALLAQDLTSYPIRSGSGMWEMSPLKPNSCLLHRQYQKTWKNCLVWTRGSLFFWSLLRTIPLSRF